MEKHALWVEKYRPHKVADCILPEDIKKTFQGFVNKKDILNLLLTGGPGMGKTTIAKAMCDEIDASYITINGSTEGIDTLRVKLAGYASAVSWKEGRKYIILDEADGLNWRMQPALRNFMEEYSHNCGFILTANYKNKIIPALQSRCAIIDFAIKKENKAKLAVQFFKRVKEILDGEGVVFDKESVANVIQKYFPDWRRVLNELQRYASTNGRIDSGILANTLRGFPDLIKFMKEKDFTSVRKWTAENADEDPELLFRTFYDSSTDYFKKEFIPQLVLIIAEYMHKSFMCYSQEINFAAFLVEVMLRAEFKTK